MKRVFPHIVYFLGFHHVKEKIREKGSVIAKIPPCERKIHEKAP
jgi:hypothetical protein